MKAGPAPDERDAQDGPRRFISRAEFAAAARRAAAPDLEAFRADQDAAAEHRTP